MHFCHVTKTDDTIENVQKRSKSSELEALEGKPRSSSGSMETRKSRTEAADSRQPSTEAELKSTQNSATSAPNIRPNDFEEKIEYVSKPNSQILSMPYAKPDGFDDQIEYTPRTNSQVLPVQSTKPDGFESRKARSFIEGCRCNACLEEKRRRELSVVQHHDDCECRQCIKKRMKLVHHETCQCQTCKEKKLLNKRKCGEQTRSSETRSLETRSLETRSSPYGRSQTPPPSPPPPLPAKDFSYTDLTCGRRPDELHTERKCPAQNECISTVDDDLERIIERKIDEIVRPLLRSMASNEKAKRPCQPTEQRRSEADDMLASHFKPKLKTSCMVSSFCNKYNELPKRKSCPMAPSMDYQEMSFGGIPPYKYHSDSSCTSLHSNTKNKKYDCPALAPYHFDDIMSCKSYTSEDDDY